MKEVIQNISYIKQLISDLYLVFVLLVFTTGCSVDEECEVRLILDNTVCLFGDEVRCGDSTKIMVRIDNEIVFDDYVVSSFRYELDSVLTTKGNHKIEINYCDTIIRESLKLRDYHNFILVIKEGNEYSFDINDEYPIYQ